MGQLTRAVPLDARNAADIPARLDLSGLPTEDRALEDTMRIDQAATDRKARAPETGGCICGHQRLLIGY
jgi:hypothetical protein